MSKKPNKAPRHGLDRDADGRPGGSLPGNQTAPYEPDAAAPDETAPDAWPHLRAAVGVILEDHWEGWSQDGDIAGAFAAITVQLDDDELAQAEAHFAGLADDEARRDLAELADLYEDAPETAQRFLRAAHAYAEEVEPAETAPDAEASATETADADAGEATETVAADDAEATETAAEDPPAEDPQPDAPPAEADKIDPTKTEAPPAEDPQPEPDAGEGDPPPTFDAEEVAAGEDLVTAQTQTAPVAVRRRELLALSRARRFYRLRDGTFAASPDAGGGVAAATVDAWCRAGLAEMVPSAGNLGGVRITPAGMGALRGDAQGEEAA